MPNAFSRLFVPYCVWKAPTPFEARTALQYFAAFLKSAGTGSAASAAGAIIAATNASTPMPPSIDAAVPGAAAAKKDEAPSPGAQPPESPA